MAAKEACMCCIGDGRFGDEQEREVVFYWA